MAVSVDEVSYTLTEQHSRIKTLMEEVLAQEGPGRQEAFDALRRFLAAHEAAEEECMHLPAMQDLGADAPEVAQRVEEEEEAGKAIAELEQLGTASPEFPAMFEKFRRAVIAHAEAEEHEELPSLSSPLDDSEVTRLHLALARVPELHPAMGRAAPPSRSDCRQHGPSFVPGYPPPDEDRAAPAQINPATPTLPHQH